MVSYYNIVEGNLHTGDIAKSSDINHIQVHIQDMIREKDLDFHDGESYILGSGDKHKNDFILTVAPKFLGRYIDDRIVFDVDSQKSININRNDVKQPILLTKSSVYSIITKLKNSSNRDIPVKFELQDINGNVLRSNTVTIPRGTVNPTDFEVVFDLEHYPTAPNMTYAKIMERDGKDIPPVTEEESYDEGFEHSHDDEEELEQFSIGVSQLYFVIKRTNLNEIDLVDSGDEKPIFDPENSLGVFYTESSPNPEKNIYCLTNSGTSFTETGKNIWFKEVYANEQTYLCTGGEAVIGGEKVQCIDTHISIEGGNTYGNIVSYVYLGLDGHLYFRNTKASMSTNIDDFEEDLAFPMPAFFLPIAAILTYSNAFGIDKEPLILQSQENGLRPLSHHERLRRLEKQIDWHEEFSMPSRLKWTITGKDWVDENGAKLFGDWVKNTAKDPDYKNAYIGTDSQGNPIIKLTDNVVTNIPITLKETFKNKDGKDISLTETDILNASSFASKTNMVLDNKKGTLTMDKKKTDPITVAKNEKEAKETKFNPWDDYKGNRPSNSKLKVHHREFTVVSGKNGSHDHQSQFPAMTFYTKTNYRLKKLTIPIFKFKNCSGVKFFIWRRQNPNNKKNTVWLEKKIHTSKVFSLKKAKVKGKYQYMEKGFTISFGKGGLSLPKGQYVIIALPIPKSGEGSIFVDTYEPKNPKDFLIVYEGASNASHFLLKTRYPEIWYNSVEATAVEEQYYTKSTATSKKIIWTDKTLGKIETIKPVIGNNIKIPDKCSYKIFADTGANWQELTPNQDNTMSGGASSFRWKIEFYGNGKDSPVLKYDSKDKYAIEFVLTRANIGASKIDQNEALDRNMCITSIPFNANDILRQYVGDPNLALTNSPFTQYEFARIWAENALNKKLSIDIQGADRYLESDGTKIPLWTYHYCDLTLDDFSKQNVDYSNYTEDVEYDENNLRLKLDSNHSYNDNDISISAIKNFVKVSNSIDNDNSTTEMNIIQKEEVKTNQLFLKTVFDNYHDLTKYTGLKFTFRTGDLGEDGEFKINGLGIYISTESDLQEVPTNKTTLSNVTTLKDTEVLPETLSVGDNQIKKYDGQIIELIHEIDKDNDGNKAPEHVFYKYVQEYDDATNQMIYKLQQLHDFKDYNLYRIDFEITSKNIITTQVDKLDSEGNPIQQNGVNVKETRKYGEYTVRIELDPNSQILKYAREIGIITMNDESDYSITNSKNTTLSLYEVKGISEDYYPIYQPKDKLFKAATLNEDNVNVYDIGGLQFTATTFDKRYNSSTSYNAVKALHNTSPETTQICIKYDGINVASEPKICYMNNTYGKLSHYKHLGIQIASDVYIPKDSLKINLCEKPNGEGVFASLNLPTINCIYNPYVATGSKTDKINLSQIFKKINSDKEIKSISITATEHFKKFIGSIVNSDIKDHINLFIGKIVLYKAETIPMFHETMRFKLYSTTDGKIDHEKSDIIKESINVRKIGTIIDYS